MGWSTVASTSARETLFRTSHDLECRIASADERPFSSFRTPGTTFLNLYKNQRESNGILVRCRSNKGDLSFNKLPEPNPIVNQNKRREFLVSLASIFTLSNAIPPSLAETVQSGAVFENLKDEINAYQFQIPLSLPNDNQKVSWVETRKPERYSSAAPLAPDARQRIVYERLDFANNLVVSVSVGPPNKAFLSKSESDVNSWQAINVARSVLADKSTARMSVEQRVQGILIEDSSSKNVDGDTYWYYEHLAQKSPTIYDSSFDVYRHSLAVSAFRDGYIYSLNVSTLNSKWPQLEGVIRGMVDSFRMTPVTKDYVPPWKDPWRFW